MVMLRHSSSRRLSSRSARVSPSISHTVSTRRQRPAAKVSLTDHPQLTRKNKPQKTVRSRHERKKLALPEYSLLGILATSGLSIAVALVYAVTFDPARDAENAMTNLARDYYIEFLYPSTLGTHINEPASILSKYVESGLPSVRLSYMLLYNDTASSQYASYFNNKYYSCDASRTNFSFFPVEPYGPRDYTVKFSYDCKKRT